MTRGSGADDAERPRVARGSPRFAICDDEILALARTACVIEEHYSKSVVSDATGH